ALAVEVQVADVEATLRLGKVGRVLGVDGPGEAELGAVGDVERVLPVLRADHGEDGAEDLLLRESGARPHFAYHRGRKDPAVDADAVPAGDDLPLAAADLDVLPRLLELLLPRERPQVDVGARRVADLQRLRLRDDAREDLVVDGVDEDR